MRSFLLIVLMSAWLPALDLTVDSSFSSNEDSNLVFSYTTLLGKCSVSEPPDGFKIIAGASDGTTEIGSSSSGPWVAPTLGVTTFTAGQYIRFSPNANINGNGILVMTVRAYKGASESLVRSVTDDIAPLPDRITAAAGTFTQPVGNEVTEDTPYTFTFSDLVTTLHVIEPDTQAFELVITTLSSGTLTTTLGAPITLPYSLASGGSFRWQADADVFTRDDEPAIAAFKAKAVNTVAPLDSTAVVTFSTHVVGVTEDPSGVPSTLTSFDPIRVVQGTMVEYTIDELLAHCNGFSDPDRTGSIVMTWETSPGEGSAVHQIYGEDNITILDLSAANLPTLIEAQTGDRIRFIMPANAPLGVLTIGNVYANAAYASAPSPRVALRYDVQTVSGGSDDSSGGGGGGGGCGAGLASVLLAIGYISAGLRRGKQRA